MSTLKFTSLDKPCEFCRDGVAKFTVKIGIDQTAFICSPCKHYLEHPEHYIQESAKNIHTIQKVDMSHPNIINPTI
jgi:hypothetical protein